MTVATEAELIAKAERRLSRLHPAWRAIIRASGPCVLRTRSQRRPNFEQLARAIVFQQLAGAAANTIWGRVRATVDGRFTPEAVAAVPDATLRGAGLSTNKLLSIRDLSTHVLDGRLKLARLSALDDDTIVEQLVHVRGIGRWTAEMFLMFQLGRIDVWPSGDLGVRNGYRRLFELAELPTVKELEAFGDSLKPYRSVAAWYCWRAADTVLPSAAPTPRSGS